MSEPVLRAAGPGDDEAVAALIGEAFPGNPKARVEVLRWQYRDNPFGVFAQFNPNVSCDKAPRQAAPMTHAGS